MSYTNLRSKTFGYEVGDDSYLIEFLNRDGKLKVTDLNDESIVFDIVIIFHTNSLFITFDNDALTVDELVARGILTHSEDREYKLPELLLRARDNTVVIDKNGDVDFVSLRATGDKGMEILVYSKQDMSDKEGIKVLVGEGLSLSLTASTESEEDLLDYLHENSIAYDSTIHPALIEKLKHLVYFADLDYDEGAEDVEGYL